MVLPVAFLEVTVGSRGSQMNARRLRSISKGFDGPHLAESGPWSYGKGRVIIGRGLGHI